MTKATTGRIIAGATVRRAVRRAINQYAGQIAERCVAAALKGEPGGLQAAAALLIAANADVLEPTSSGNPAPRDVEGRSKRPAARTGTAPSPSSSRKAASKRAWTA